MKKKLNILFFISTLCLFFGVVVMGVYAATEVNYSISGTISYDAPEAELKVGATHISGAGQTETTAYSDNSTLLAERVIQSNVNLSLGNGFYFLNNSTSSVYDIIIKFNFDNYTVPYSLKIQTDTSDGAFAKSSGLYYGKVTCQFSTSQTGTYSDSCSITLAEKGKGTIYVKFHAEDLSALSGVGVPSTEPKLFGFVITPV